MLTKEDLKEIKSVVQDTVRVEVAGILEENVLPQFDEMHRNFAQVDQRFAQIDQRFAQIDQRFDDVYRELGHIRAKMVTRMDLEDRLADFKISLKGSV